MSGDGLLPFRPEFGAAVLSGRKTVTSRTRRYGKAGDRLATNFGVFVVLTNVVRVPLKAVRDLLWDREGCDSPEDFERVWRSIHPRHGFDPAQRVWVHHFEVAS